MKKYLFAAVFFLGLSFSLTAQSVLGKWHSMDPDTGSKESVIEVYLEGDKLYGKIIEILKEEDKDKKCIECTGKDKNKPIEGDAVSAALCARLLSDGGRGVTVLIGAELAAAAQELSLKL